MLGSSIVFIGDLTVDTYPVLGNVHLGGASLNGAMWAMRSGGDDVSIVAAVGSDKAGTLFRNKIRAEHIGDCGISVLNGKTSTIEIFIDSCGERRWGRWDPGVLEDYHLGERELTYLQTKHAVSLSIYGKTIHLLHELSAWGEKNRKDTQVTVNFDDLSQFGNSISVVRDYVDGIDAGFFGLDVSADKQHIRDLRDLANITGKLMVITLGTRGSLAFHGTREFAAPADEVKKVVDTTGAGDAFLAGFMVHYMKSYDILSSLKAGNSLAARKIQLLGAY